MKIDEMRINFRFLLKKVHISVYSLKLYMKIAVLYNLQEHCYILVLIIIDIFTFIRFVFIKRSSKMIDSLLIC